MNAIQNFIARADPEGRVIKQWANGRHWIEFKDKPLGCERCRELGTPGRQSLETVKTTKRDGGGFKYERQRGAYCDCEYGQDLWNRETNGQGIILPREEELAQRKQAQIEQGRILFDWHFPRILDGLGMKTWVAKFGEDPNKQDLYRACQMAAMGRGSKKGILAHGSTGTGKTGALVGLLKYMEERGEAVMFITFDDIYLASLDSNGSQRSRYLKSVPVLMIDELVHSTSEWMGWKGEDKRELAYSIINARYNSRLPTFITTNCTIEKLGSTLGSQVVDRLRDMCEFVSVTGESGRGSEE